MNKIKSHCNLIKLNKFQTFNHLIITPRVQRLEIILLNNPSIWVNLFLFYKRKLKQILMTKI